MSEEEKEAIRDAKSEIEVEKSVNCMFAKWLDIERLQILLNLIDKLQKENEELKDNIETYEETINDYESEAKRDEEEIDKLQNENSSLKKEIRLMKSVNINDNYISKDKIRNKIKELNRKTKGCETGKEVKAYFQAQVLEELLGDDE